MDTKSEIFQYIINYIEKKGKLDENTDFETFDYTQSGHIDSLALFKFIVDLEDHFNIDLLDDVHLPEFRKIGGLVKIIKHRLEEK